MIRVNLLESLGPNKGRADSLVGTGGASAFISRRETLLGFACLGIAGAALFVQLGGPGRGEDAAATLSVGGTVEEEKSLIHYIEEEEAAEATESEENLGDPGWNQELADAVEENAAVPAKVQGAERATPPDRATADSAPSVLRRDSRLESKSTDAAQPVTPELSLSQLVVSSEGDALRVFAVTGMQPEYRTFRLEKPSRVVVDLPGVRLTLPRGQLEQAPDHPQVSRIRAGQYQIDPPRARLVLDVTSFPDVEILPQFNGLYLVITERSQ